MSNGERIISIQATPLTEYYKFSNRTYLHDTDLLLENGGERHKVPYTIAINIRLNAVYRRLMVICSKHARRFSTADFLNTCYRKGQLVMQLS